MKLIFPDIDHVFCHEENSINVLVIENPSLFLRVVTDVSNQLMGMDGKTVLSDNDQQLHISKSLEMMDQFVPFSLNQKPIITKIASELNKEVVRGEYYSDLLTLLSQIEQFLLNISFPFSGNIAFSDISLEGIIKASGMKIDEEGESLPERIVDYMELASFYLGKKCFLTVNLRSYLSDTEAEALMNTIIGHGFFCIMIENHEYQRNQYEKRFIIDVDLCELQ